MGPGQRVFRVATGSAVGKCMEISRASASHQECRGVLVADSRGALSEAIMASDACLRNGSSEVARNVSRVSDVPRCFRSVFIRVLRLGREWMMDSSFVFPKRIANSASYLLWGHIPNLKNARASFHKSSPKCASAESVLLDIGYCPIRNVL
uniref:Uncharacterized protein n=1 Tax=Steinernema glaseri TaxID=37863 RepID=A0A1I7YS62_9BILA